MRVIQTVAVGKAAIGTVPEPKLANDSILVRPTHVGNNPCDVLITDMLFTEGQIAGCDYCGIVEKVGANVNTNLKPGDKVVGAVAGGVGCDVTRGAFAELIPAYGDFIFPLPNNVSEAPAATLGVGISTIAVSFYEHLGLPLPNVNPDFGQGNPFFVYGGSSAMGLFGIQFAKLSGFRVICTCSEKNFELVKSYGADEAYDYHDIDQCTRDIKRSVGDELQYAYVCVRDQNTPKLCADIMSSKGGTYCTIVGDECNRDNIKSRMTFGQSAMCSPYRAFTSVLESSKETRATGQKVWDMSLKLLDEGKLKTPPMELRKGLEGALQGIDDLRNGRISGKKVISQLS